MEEEFVVGGSRCHQSGLMVESRYPNIGLSMGPAKRFIEVLKRTVWEDLADVCQTQFGPTALTSFEMTDIK